MGKRVPAFYFSVIHNVSEIRLWRDYYRWTGPFYTYLENVCEGEQSDSKNHIVSIMSHFLCPILETDLGGWDLPPSLIWSSPLDDDERQAVEEEGTMHGN